MTPVADPAAQVRYWIAEGIRAHTSMTEDEAQSSTNALLEQWQDATRGGVKTSEPPTR